MGGDAVAGNQLTREVTAGELGDEGREDKRPPIHEFCPRDCTTAADVTTIIFYHMLPFTPVPSVCSMIFLWWSFRHASWVVPTLFIALCIFLVALPPYYDRVVRRRVQYLYMALARYMHSACFSVPLKPAPEGSYIIACHPHGRMFYSSSMVCQLDDIWRRSFLPKGDLFIAAAAGFFSVPFLRNLLYCLGTMPASRSNIIHRLRQGNHVAIVVGGLKEVCVGTNDHTDILYLLNRKGFAKIAVEEKKGVIPVYCFGETQLFRHDPMWLLNFWAGVNKYVNIGVPFMRGYWQLPLPFRRELLCVVGDPVIPLENESVSDFHARYVKQLTSLFNQFVEVAPNPKLKLILR